MLPLIFAEYNAHLLPPAGTSIPNHVAFATPRSWMPIENIRSSNTPARNTSRKFPKRKYNPDYIEQQPIPRQLQDKST
ncbi:hypothetical protein Lal_00000980 [Lupinus albus]|nr:hypothetical protein Lal_00000980 [Lupinus albus]